MAKIVYNRDYGGFGLSDKAIQRYSDLKGLTLLRNENGTWDLPTGQWFEDSDLDRHDHALVQVVEELGEEANAEYSDLRIREVPDGSKYRIHDYDGAELVILLEEHDWCTAI